MPDLATYLIQHLSLSGTWLSVIPRMNLKDTCLQKIELCVENIITILGSILNIIERWGGGYNTIQQARESSLQKRMRYSYMSC